MLGTCKDCPFAVLVDGESGQYLVCIEEDCIVDEDDGCDILDRL